MTNSSENRPEPALTTTLDIKVPFSDVDMLGIVWHGRYVQYFEMARCALLEQYNYGYLDMRASGYSWPVIEVRVRYPGSALFGETIRVKATIAEWEHRLKVDYEIRNAEGKRLTKGYTIQVAVDSKSQEMCMESPPVLREKLGIPIE